MIHKKWHILIPLAILFGFVTYYVLTTSNLVRFWADDFCSSVLLRNEGFLKAQITWWNGWTGRYSYIAFLDLFELFGVMGAKVLPMILFALFSVTSILILGMTAFLLVPIFLVNSPNIIQSFYWMTGSLNYFIPFVFLNFFILILVKSFKRYSYLLGFLLLFIATGFSEAFGVANILLLSLLIIIIENKDRRKLLLVGLLATVMSLGIMYFAPGNAVRSSLVSHPANLVELIKSTFVYSRWYLFHLFYIKTFVVSIFAIITCAFVFLNPKLKYFKNPRMVMTLSLGFVVGVTLTVVGLTYEAMNWEPPERVMSIVNNMIIIGTIVFSIGLFQIANSYVPKYLSKILFVILVLFLTYFVNIDWRKVKQELKASAESSVYMTVGKLDGLEDNKGWVKSCIIEYYK